MAREQHAADQVATHIRAVLSQLKSEPHKTLNETE
jgi:hypothetical protein